MDMKIGEMVITGDWNGQPIFRRRTAEEVLLNELQKNDEARKLKVQHFPSDYPSDEAMMDDIADQEAKWGEERTANE